MKKGKRVDWVIIGDPHINKLENYFPGQDLELQIAELNKPLRYALKNGVPNVLIAGDVSHKERLSEEGQIALYNLLIKYDGKLNIHIILGNHDVAMKGVHSLQFFDEIYKSKRFKSVHIHALPKQLVMEGIPFNMLPFPATKALPHEGLDKSVNFAHLERPGAVRDNGRAIAKKDGIKQKDKNVWVIGHLHTPQKVGLSYFVGTMYQTNFGESLPKGFIHLQCRAVDGKLKFKVERIENDPKFKMINLKIEKKSDLKKIDSNPLHLYKLFVKTGVKLENTDIAKFKNLYKTPTTYDTDKDLSVKQETEIELVEHSLTYGLAKGLKAKGATKWQRKRGLKLVKDIVESLKKKSA